MFINEQEDIRYHIFLKKLRKKNQVSQTRVCEGIYTVSAMNRFENGNRIAEKLIRDRFTARLGISCERYEDYLQPKEYVRWEQRMRIVQAIEKRKLEQAKEELDAYALSAKDNCVQLQFVDTMRYMILRLEDAPREMLLDMLRSAVKYTVPNVKKALAGVHLLSDQEINLIAELIDLEEPEDVSVDVNEWRIAQYEKLIAYIDDSHWEKLQKAKIYPRIENRICQTLQKKEEWSDFCYLYYENECHDIAKVIESRRQACGIPRKKVIEGICTERTLVRLEREGRNPSMNTVMHLFDRIGLHADYRRARVLTNDVEVLWLFDEVIRNKNHGDFESWEENLKKLRNSLSMDIPQNKQEVSCLFATLMYQRGAIGKEEFCIWLKSAFEYTLPINALHGEGKEYLTKSERVIMDLLEMEKN